MRWPSISSDGLTIYYDTGGQLTVATRSNAAAAFDAPNVLLIGISLTGATPPGKFGSTPYLTADGQALYYDEDGEGSRIFRVPWLGTNWGEPEAVSELDVIAANNDRLDSPDTFDYPTLSADGRTIYFRKYDQHHDVSSIWVAQRGDDSGPFDPPVLAPNLSPANFEGPVPNWIAADGCRMYFTNEVPLHGQELFVAERGR
jgi:WD40-like Beta Propeller Repeat